MCWCSSMLPISRIVSLPACGGGCHICRSSNTCRRAFGSGGPGAHAQCGPRSISCSPCCRSSPKCIISWVVRTASMSGTPCLSISPPRAPAGGGDGRGAAPPPLVLALPGSRTHEVERLATIFGETLGMVAAKSGPLEVVLPTVPHLVARLSELTSRWPIRPRIVVDEAEKHAAFRRARAALAASGTVTLELALAGVPSVAAYRVPTLEELMLRMMVRIHPVIKVRSVILANLVLGEFAIPEFLQRHCTADNLAAALTDVL